MIKVSGAENQTYLIPWASCAGTDHTVHMRIFGYYILTALSATAGLGFTAMR